jgi:glycosyltransferase involved in cell wall biosynthesis
VTKSILLLTRYGRRGASSRVRHYQYLRHLGEAGYDVTVQSFFEDNYIDILYGDKSRIAVSLEALWRRYRHLSRPKDYDLIWIEKEALPWCPAWLEARLISGRQYVVDYDDIWCLRYREHESALVRQILGNKLDRLVARASAVVAGNQYIAEWSAAAGAPMVVTIPNAVNIDHYPLSDLPDGPFTIGWIGSRTTEGTLLAIAPALRELQMHSGAKIRLIGASSSFSIPGVEADMIPWSEETEAAELAKIHVGIMPLIDSTWNRGKSGYKALQYMASGRPVIASAVGPGPLLVSHNKTGVLVREVEVEDWIAALRDLSKNPEKIRTLGCSGRRRAENEFSTGVLAPRLIRLFDALTQSESHGPR